MNYYFIQIMYKHCLHMAAEIVFVLGDLAIIRIDE